MILTDVQALLRGFGTPAAEPLPVLSAAEAEALLPELPAGSMAPKIGASVAFARETGGEVLITSAESLPHALGGESGTRITP